MLKRGFFSNIMVATYVVDAALIAAEHSLGGDWHEKMMLALIVLMFGKFIDLSVSLAKLERENSPWKEEQQFIEDHPDFAAWVRSVIGNYNRAQGFTNNTYQEHLQEDLEEFRVRMGRYSHGHIENSQERPPGFFYRHPDYFERDTEKRMVATCIVERGAFWEVGSSKLLLERQGQLASRGIEVMRIFIERKEGLARLQPAIDLHQQNCVPVRIALIDDDSNPVPERLHNDFMVIDESVLIRQEMRNGKLASTKVWLGQDTEGKREIDIALLDFESLKTEYSLPPVEAFRRAGIPMVAATKQLAPPPQK